MLPPMIATLSVALAWVVLCAAFVGWGTLVARLLKLPTTERLLPFDLFWVGWCSVVTGLQLWHLWLPVGGAALILFLGIGCASLLALRKWLALRCVIPSRCSSKMLFITRVFIGKRGATADATRSQTRILAVVLLSGLLFWANIAIGSPHDYDTGLYHMQAVRWIGQFPIVPGLGNLQGRIAFNNSSFLYAAMLDVGPFVKKSHHLSNGLLAVVVIGHSLCQLFQAIVRKKLNRYQCFLLLMLPATILWCYKHTSSYSPEVPIFLLGVVISGQLLRFSGNAQPNSPQRSRADFNRWIGFSICLMGAAGVIVKLSFAPMAALGILIVLWRSISLHRVGISLITNWRFESVVCSTILIAIVPWVVRGVILSGYIGYPQTILSCDVDWRIPKQTADDDRNWIVAWARQPGAQPEEVLGTSAWIGPWFLHQGRDIFKVVLPCVMVLLASVSLIKRLRQLKRTAENNSSGGEWLWILPSAVTIVFVLVTAPDLSRFVGASLWIVAAGLTVNAIWAWRIPATGAEIVDEEENGPTIDFDPRRWNWQQWSAASRPERWRRAIFSLAAVLVLLMTIKAARYTSGPSDDGFGQIPEANLIETENSQGVTVWIPQKGEDDRVWDAPLLSAPSVKDRLSLRRPGELGGGFRIQP